VAELSEPVAINTATAAVTASISGSKVIENEKHYDSTHSPSTSDRRGIYHLRKASAHLFGKVKSESLNDPISGLQSVSNESYCREDLETDQLSESDLITLNLQIRDLISLLANGVQSTHKVRNEEGVDTGLGIKEMKESTLGIDTSLLTDTIDQSSEGGGIVFESTLIEKDPEGSRTSMAGIGTDDDIYSRRVVDVYTATVPISIGHLNGENLLRNRSSLGTHGNELGNAKMLLFELQTHIEMLEVQKCIVERIQTEDLDNNMDNITTNHGNDVMLSSDGEKEALLDTKNGDINTGGVKNEMKDVLNSANSDSSKQEIYDNVADISPSDIFLLPSHQNSNRLVTELSTVLNSIKGHRDEEFGDSSDDDF
jgi:hypothetical protein